MISIKNTLQACIFDLDGVLVDTAIYHYEAWKRLANELGFDFTHDQNEQLKGISRMDSLEKILEWGDIQISQERKIELSERKNSWYVQMISSMKEDEVLPGTRELLETIRAAGLKCALGSASRNSALILDRTSLISYFDVIVDGNSVTASKPDPEVFTKGANLLGIDPSNCIVFEDGIAGIKAAISAGMKVIGIGQPDVLKLANVVYDGLDKIQLSTLKNLFNKEP
jgi:beta-phosphoglucomutase